MITTVINYCSNDFRFLQKNITEALKFSEKVIIPISSHFFDGTLENKEDLEKTYKLLELSDKITFIEYGWDDRKSARYHHNMSRWIGLQDSTTDYVLLADADEIVDGDLMNRYLQTKKYLNYDVIAFACYWYFREPIYRATTTELAVSLWNKHICKESLIFNESERWSYRFRNDLRVLENETYNGEVMCHHYSWVRTYEQMLKKVQSWGHTSDKDWISLVNEEFSREFNGTDFVHHYTYDIVPNTLDGV